MTPEEPAEPDWDLLPGYPERFFNLEPGYDRRDLKRAYNRLLRRFKPEKFPEEFKRLRSAFEDLERTLKYAARRGDSESYEGDDSEEVPDGTQPSESSHPGFDCIERIKRESPEQVAIALESFEPKTSEHWCQLALLREGVPDAMRFVFYETLIAGVRATDGAQSVTALLYEACRETVPQELRLRLLEQMHELCEEGHGNLGVCAEGFFYLTERLWLDLATSMEFPDFAELLQSEREAFGDEAFEGYLGLLIRLLPRLGLRGDPDWVNEATELIDEHYHSLAPGAQNAVLEADWVERYRASRHWLVNGHPLRDQIDRTLVMMSAGDPVAGPAAVSDLFAELRRDPDALLDAFEPGEVGEFDSFLDPLWWYAEENEAELGGARRHRHPNKMKSRVLNFARRVESRTDWSPLGVLWLACTLGTLGVMLALVIVLPCAIAVQFTEGEPIWRFASIIGWLLFVFKGKVSGVTLASLMLMPSTRWSRVFSKRIYAKYWRSMLVEFLGSTHIPHDALLQNLYSIDDPGISNCQFLAEHASDDPAVSLVSLAMQFDSSSTSS